MVRELMPSIKMQHLKHMRCLWRYHTGSSILTFSGHHDYHHHVSGSWGAYTVEHPRVFHRFSIFSANDPEVNPGLKHTDITFYHTTAKLDAQETPQEPATPWTKFTSTIKIFTTGVKALYGDLKLINEYRRKYGRSIKIQRTAPNSTENGRTNILYSREEFQFVYRTTRDLKKMLPTIVLFFIPFLGYIAPFIAFMYSDKLLSRHFLSPTQTAALQTSRSNSQKTSFVSLKDRLKEKHVVVDDLSFVPKMIEQFSGDENGVISSLNTSRFQRFPTDHWDDLSRGWSVQSFLPATVEQQRLRDYLEYIFICDWLIRIEGGTEKFSHTDLLTACVERGLYFDLDASENERASEMKAKLDSWIRISTQYKECPPLLLAYMPVAQYS